MVTNRNTAWWWWKNLVWKFAILIRICRQLSAKDDHLEILTITTIISIIFFTTSSVLFRLPLIQKLSFWILGRKVDICLTSTRIISNLLAFACNHLDRSFRLRAGLCDSSLQAFPLLPLLLNRLTMACSSWPAACDPWRCCRFWPISALHHCRLTLYYSSAVTGFLCRAALHASFVLTAGCLRCHKNRINPPNLLAYVRLPLAHGWGKYLNNLTSRRRRRLALD